ncbi:MAG TPA: ATP-binding cassette domain-containing protein [Gemmatimonadetes bacterium]|nr:ATP-binding cassette domain-containing protein [Gemmatimonadota bacterium]
MALISTQDLEMAYGGLTLLEDANLRIERGERVGLLGRNGAGKSTLLRILSGAVPPDGGTVQCESGVRVSLLAQQSETDVTGTVDSVIRSGLSASTHDDHPVERLCSILSLERDSIFSELSGGQKRRALLGRALIAEPDVLLLDEPTNHLDIESIEWLESFLTRYNGSLLFVTHDRTFLQRLATRILDLDRGSLRSWSCDYPTFLERKEHLLATQEKEHARFDKVLAREEVWIRQGIKARRTRNEGRVRALQELRAGRAARREQTGYVNLKIQKAERSGTRVIEVRNLSFDYDGPPLVSGLNTTIVRGDKVGLVGPNGCGKTTLLNLLLGRMSPKSGSVKHGTSLDIAYFDQHRDQLDESETVAEAIAGGSEYIDLGEGRKHVIGYLKDFLFSADRAKEPVRNLSGGERNRVLLARLFAVPANVLVLDEPTNDLDTETLELLEARLVEFAGTVLVVSHDRTFLDNLCTSTLVFEGGGVVKEFVGGYSDWKRAASGEAEAPGTVEPKREGSGRQGKRSAPQGKRSSPVGKTSKPKASASKSPKKLSWNERREWEELPAHIERLEADLGEVHERMADPTFFQKAQEEIRPVIDRSHELPGEIEEAFERWAALDERS